LLLTLLKTGLTLSILWAVLALAVQVARARAGGQRDYSRRAGDPVRGMVYSFTAAMLPAHKETIRHHPLETSVGVVMHVGVLLCILGICLLIAWPAGGHRLLLAMRPVVVAAFLAGLALFVRRSASRTLRAISAPDDFLANLATCALLAFAFLSPVNAQCEAALLSYTILFFLYVPLGKLRHAVFFFAARADYGRRLGYRGVYPPARAEAE